MTSELYPTSENVKILFGEALWRSGDKNAGSQMLQKVLEDNPENVKAKKLLDKIISN